MSKCIDNLHMSNYIDSTTRLTASFKLRIVSQPPNAWGIEPATVQALFCLTFFDLCSGQGALRRRLSARARAVAIA